MIYKRSLFLFLFLALFLLVNFSGCLQAEGDIHHSVSGEPEQGPAGEVAEGLRPEKYWEEVWKIRNKESNVEMEDGQVYLKASCLLQYQGEKPVEDVQVMILSPLSERLVCLDSAQNYGTISPGEEIEYYLSQPCPCPAWQETPVVGCSEKNFIDDFTLNSYVDITWSYEGQQHNVKFFDWSEEFPVS